MKMLFTISGAVAALVLGLAVAAWAVDRKGSYSPEMQAKIAEVQQQLKKLTDEKATVEKNLQTFHELDFVVFNRQE